MKGIMLISVIQTPVLLIGAILVFVIGLVQVGGWQEVVTYMQNNGTIHLMRPSTDPKFPWTGIILGSAIAGFWYWCTDQHIVQRALAARNLTQARRGTIFAGYLKLLPVFMFLIPGVMAAILKQKGVLQFGSNDMAYGSLVASLLPMGIRGILVVGFIAALMTSLAAHFNSSATLFTIDFYKNYKPDASEHRLVWVGRIATIVVVLLGLIWIPIMRGLGNVLYEYLQNVQSLIAPGIAAVFLLGLFNRKITPKAGEWGLIVGFMIGMFRLTLMILSKHISEGSIFDQLLAINWLHFSIFLLIFIMGLMAVISMITPKASEEQLKGITYFSQSPEQLKETRESWNKWDVILSGGAVLLVLGFYYYFW
jgi:SSS family solute:Na+ symporter